MRVMREARGALWWACSQAGQCQRALKAVVGRSALSQTLAGAWENRAGTPSGVEPQATALCRRGLLPK